MAGRKNVARRGSAALAVRTVSVTTRSQAEKDLLRVHRMPYAENDRRPPGWGKGFEKPLGERFWEMTPGVFSVLLPSGDPISLGAKLLNMGCFLLAALVVTWITDLRRQGPALGDKREASWGGWLCLCVARYLATAAGVVWAIGALWLIGAGRQPGGVVVFALFSLGCAAILGSALRRRSWLGACIAGLGLLGSVLPLIPGR